MIITETWHAQSTDISLRRNAPPGYLILDAPRPVQNRGHANCHDGIAVIHTSDFTSRRIMPTI